MTDIRENFVYCNEISINAQLNELLNKNWICLSEQMNFYYNFVDYLQGQASKANENTFWKLINRLWII